MNFKKTVADFWYNVQLYWMLGQLLSFVFCVCASQETWKHAPLWLLCVLAFMLLTTPITYYLDSKREKC